MVDKEVAGVPYQQNLLEIYPVGPRVLRKAIYGEVFYGKHSNMKSLKEAAGCHTLQKTDTGDAGATHSRGTLLQNHLVGGGEGGPGAEKATDCQILLTIMHCINQRSCQEPQHSRTAKEGPFLFQWDCSSNINRKLDSRATGKEKPLKGFPSITPDSRAAN